MSNQKFREIKIKKRLSYSTWLSISPFKYFSFPSTGCVTSIEAVLNENRVNPTVLRAAMVNPVKSLVQEDFLNELGKLLEIAFGNPSISSHDMSKKSFTVKTGSRLLVTTFFHHYFDQTWTYAVWISKIRLLVLKICARSLFPSKPEVDFQRQHFSVITSIKPYHIPFEFRKSVQ